MRRPQMRRTGRDLLFVAWLVLVVSVGLLVIRGSVGSTDEPLGEIGRAHV